MWDLFIYQFSVRARRKSRYFYWYERIVNFLNRQIVSERALACGVWYQACSVGKRYDIYSYVFDKYVQRPVDYLEFGVYRGGSMRFALEKLGSDCNFFGFDSFEGLPEDWYYGVDKGEFRVLGMPQITNSNVTFIKGLFEDSLPTFLSSTTLKKFLVLHMDADLYSSTICVLRTLKDHIVPGVIVIFDEYWFVKDEFRALKEFVNETGKNFEYLAITETRAAVRFV
jgi:hypothetical protein